MFERHLACLAFSRAAPNAGSNIAARIPMMAMTTSSSIRVNAPAAPTPFRPWFRRPDTRHPIPVATSPTVFVFRFFMLSFASGKELPADRSALHFVIILLRLRCSRSTPLRSCPPAPIAAFRYAQFASRGRHAPQSARRRTAAIPPAAVPTPATGHLCSSPAARSVAPIPNLYTNLVDNISLSIQ